MARDRGTMATTIAKSSSKSTAPGQYLGYGLQDVRLCRHLLKAPPGCTVSLEFIEDTAIHRLDGTMVLEQSKSALSGNPLADGSVELWKCFANWASLCADGEVDPATSLFHLYVCPHKQGTLVEQLHAAASGDDAVALLAKIAKKVTLGNKLKGCNPKITEFLDAGPAVCVPIIRNFRLIMSDDPLEPIREMLRFSVLEEALDDFCGHAIGMAKTRIGALIRAGVPPILDALKFRRDLQAFVRKHGALGLLAPTTDRPTAVEVDAILAAAPIFVQQLLKVEMATEHVVRAVSDYLRSDADRTQWAAEGRIIEESLDELHDTLEAHFALTRDEIEDLQISEAPEARGRQLYRRCITRQAPLEGRAVPGYFIPGTFNMLADTSRVGWHPHYSDFFPNE